MRLISGFAVAVLLAAAWAGAVEARPLADPAAGLSESLRVPWLDSPDELSKPLQEGRFGLVYDDQLRHFTALSPETRLRVVGPVFTEYLHVFVHDPLHVDQADDFSHLRLWAGRPGSASRHLAALYFDHFGLPLDGLNLEESPDVSEANVLGLDGIDVAFVAAVPGYEPLCLGMRRGTHTLLPLDYETLRSLALAPDRSTGLQWPIRFDSIPSGTYFGQEDPVPAIDRSLLLVAPAGTAEEPARRMLDEARTVWAKLPQAAREKRCRSDLDDVPASLEKASDLRWLAGSPPGSLWQRAGSWGLGALCGLVLLGLLLQAWRRGVFADLRAAWLQDRLPFLILVALALSIAAITVGTYLFEHDINEKFSSIPESFWSITIYLCSGLEDRTPYTPAGRLTATLGLLLGPAFFAVLSGWLARFFIRREKKMPQNLKGHYLLLNWNEKALNVVREIHHPVLLAHEGPSVIVVLTDREDLTLQQLKECGSGRDEAFEDFFLSIGDPTSERALLNANAQEARAIVIFADETEGDERAFRSIFALRRIAREKKVEGMHVVVELLDNANTPILDEMARDFPWTLERVSNMELQTYLLAQATMSPGLVKFYTDLLRTTGDTNELYAVAVPDGAVGIPFADYAALLFKTDLPEPLVPVGIRRKVKGKYHILTNPQPRHPDSVLRVGDHLLVLAQDPPPPGSLPVPAGREDLLGV